MNRFEKCLAGALCATMVAALSGCGDTAWTHRSANAEVTSGMYVGFTIDATQQVASAEGYDSSLEIKDMTLDGVNGITWLQSTADDLAIRYLTIEEKFAEMGLSFTEEELADQNAYVAAYWNYMSSYYEPQGCGEASFKKILINTEKQTRIFDAIYGEGGEQEVPAAELQAIYDEEYVKTVYITVPLIDSSYAALEGDELDEAKELADGLLQRVEIGEDIELVKAEVSYGEGAEAGDTAEYIKEGAGYPEKLTEALMAANIGDCGMVEDTSYIYIWKKFALDDAGFEQNRSTILSNLKRDEFLTRQDKWAAELEVTRNDASIKKHSPKNLKTN